MGLLDQVQGQGGGAGAPGFKFAEINQGVMGVITSASLSDQTRFGTNPPEKILDDDGKPKKQVVVVLQTGLRNWAGIDPDHIPKDDQGRQKPPSEDTGLRAIFLKNQMAWKVTDRVREAGLDDIRVGDTLGVKYVSDLNVNKGNPAKQYEAVYQKAADSVSLSSIAPPPAAAPAAPPAQPAPAAAAPPPPPVWNPTTQQYEFPAPPPPPAPAAPAAPPPPPVWNPATQQYEFAAPAAPATPAPPTAPATAQPPATDPWAAPPTGQAPPPF